MLATLLEALERAADPMELLAVVDWHAPTDETAMAEAIEDYEMICMGEV